jgi:hypothetical protein
LLFVVVVATVAGSMELAVVSVKDGAFVLAEVAAAVVGITATVSREASVDAGLSVETPIEGGSTGSSNGRVGTYGGAFVVVQRYELRVPNYRQNMVSLVS